MEGVLTLNRAKLNVLIRHRNVQTQLPYYMMNLYRYCLTLPVYSCSRAFRARWSSKKLACFLSLHQQCRISHLSSSRVHVSNFLRSFFSIHASSIFFYPLSSFSPMVILRSFLRKSVITYRTTHATDKSCSFAIFKTCSYTSWDTITKKHAVLSSVFFSIFYFPYFCKLTKIFYTMEMCFALKK